MPPHPQRGRRWLLLALGVGAAVVLAIRALLPWALARGLEWAGRKQLGLPVQVANVDLGLLRGVVVVEGVALGAPDEPGQVHTRLRSDRLSANLAWTDLWSRRLRLERLELDGLELQLARLPDGRIDGLPASSDAEPAASGEPETDAAWPLVVDRLTLRDVSATLVEAADARRLAALSFDALELKNTGVEEGGVQLADATLRAPRVEVARDFLAAAGGAPVEEPEAAAAEEPSPGLAYHIEHLRVEDGDVVVDSKKGSFELALALEARSVGGATGERFPLELEVGIGDGTLRFEGQVGTAPVALDGHLVWSDLPLPPLALVSRPELAAWLRSCHASGDLQLSLRTVAGETPPGLTVRGASRVDALELVDPDEGEVSLAWQSFRLDGIDVAIPLGAAPDGEAAPVRSVHVGSVKLLAPRVHWVQPPPFAREVEAEMPESEAPGPPTHISVGSFELADGDVELVDRSVTPAYTGGLRDLRIDARELRWPPGEVGSLELHGLAPEAAPLTVTGKLENDVGELKLDLDRLALVPLDPFARRAGYGLEGGDASLEVHARRSPKELKADTELVLHRLDLDVADAGRFESVFGVPPAMALALLRGPNGDIDLDIPIRSDAAGLRVGLAEIVRDALRQALTGALATPLKAVGAVIPRGAEAQAVGFEPLESPPGEPALTAQAKARLDGLARLLKERPGLGLELIGGADAADRAPLAQALRAEATGAEPGVAAGGEAAAASEAQLLGLARSRAERVREALVHRGVDPERLRVAEPTASGPAGVGLELFAR